MPAPTSVPTRILTLLCGLILAGAATATPAAAGGDGATVFKLSGTAERQVENDRMIATLVAEARAPEAPDAAAEVNQRMEGALAHLEAFEHIDTRTLDYSTRAIQDRNDRSRITAWQVRQSLELRGGDFDSLTERVGELQQEHELTVSGIRFGVSAEREREARREMIDDAVEDLTDQARAMARSIGASHLRPLEMELTRQRSHGPQPMMARSEGVASAPALEAGESTLTIRVDGRMQALGADTLRVTPR